MSKSVNCSYFETLYICRGFIPLALIALIPALISKPEAALTAIGAYGINLLFLLIIFIYGLFRVKNKRLLIAKKPGKQMYFAKPVLPYRFKAVSHNMKKSKAPPDILRFESGVLEKKEACFSYDSIQSMIIEKRLIPLIFFSERVILNTSATPVQGGFFSMFIYLKDENRLFAKLFSRKNSFETVYKSNLFNIFFMALSSSNAFAGVLIFIPFLNKTGELLGEHYKSLIFSSLDFSLQIQSAGVPPFAAGIAGILLTGLIISVISVIFSYGFLKVQKSPDNDSIIVKRGIIEKNIFVTLISNINAYEIKQSLLMCLMKICSLKFYAAGQSRESKSKRVIIPSLSVRQAENFFEISRCSKNFFAKPAKYSQRSYLYFPMFWIALLCLGCISGYLFKLDILPFFPLILFAFIMLAVLFVMRIFAFKRAFIYADGKKAVVSFYKRLSFTKTLIPAEKIQGVKITQSIFQKHRNLCNIYLYAYSENKRRFKIKHLKLSDGIEFSKIISGALAE